MVFSSDIDIEAKYMMCVGVLGEPKHCTGIATKHTHNSLFRLLFYNVIRGLLPLLAPLAPSRSSAGSSKAQHPFHSPDLRKISPRS